MRVTCGIPTKNRYDNLILTLLSLAQQTFRDFDIIIVDDSDDPKDVRQFPNFAHVFQLLDFRGIGWQVVWGTKRGQHYSHHIIQDMSKSEWIWRIDDDEVAEPETLQKLLARTGKDVGAVGGLVLTPPGTDHILKAPHAANIIEDLNRPNLQWFIGQSPGVVSVDHLHSTFLYRKGAANYELGLSPAAHREETLFTYEIKRNGYRVLFDPSITTWHFRAPQGGIRSHQDVRFWEDDEKLFHDKLQEWGIHESPHKTIVLDGGLGDHVVLKSLLPELREKYKNLTIAVCNEEVFEDSQVEMISIAEARNRLGNIDRYNIYRNMIDWNWKNSLQDAFRKLYKLAPFDQ